MTEGFPTRIETCCQTMLVVLGLAVFLALCLYQIELPGLHYDEAREAGVPAMQLLKRRNSVVGQPVETFRGSGIRIKGRVFPLMVTDYIGALNIYLLLPFFALLGSNVLALRLMPIVFAVLTLLLTYLLAQQLFNRRTALITCLLLAVNPSFIFWSRQGVFVTSITATIAIASLLCWLRWYRERRARYLYWGAYLFGLGLYAKLLFLWVIVALGVTFFVLKASSLREGFRLWAISGRLGYKQLVIALLCFLLGIFPLIIYNVQTKGTFLTLTGNLTSTYYDASNLAFAENLATRLEQFKVVLNGGHLWYLGGVFTNDLYPFFFVCVGLACIPVVLLKARHEWHRVAFPFLMLAFMVLASCFTVSALWFTHYAILVPFLPMAIAAALDLLVRYTIPSGVGHKGNHIRQLIPSLVMFLVMAVLAVSDLQVDLRYHQALARSGGYAAHSDASYELARYLQDQGVASPLAMDWGIDATVQFLTLGAVNPIEIFGYEWEPDRAFEERLVRFLPNPDSVYVFHSPGETIFHRRQAFDRLVVEMGKVGRVEEVILDRSGKSIFVLVRVSEGGV
jgi:4-amino-4-deoxy-L-arabinose transferase-like glycosyltransferase